MTVDGSVGRGGVVENGGAESSEVGAGDDEEEDDGDEAGEIKDGGLADIRERWWVEGCYILLKWESKRDTGLVLA